MVFTKIEAACIKGNILTFGPCFIGTSFYNILFTLNIFFLHLDHVGLLDHSLKVWLQFWFGYPFPFMEKLSSQHFIHLWRSQSIHLHSHAHQQMYTQTWHIFSYILKKCYNWIDATKFLQFNPMNVDECKNFLQRNKDLISICFNILLQCAGNASLITTFRTGY